METTRRLIENSGGKAVRLEDIAQASGVSRQAIYLHFGSRSGLMVATVQHIDEEAGIEERTQHVRDEEDSLQALDLYVEFWAGYVPTIYGLAKELLAQRATDEAAEAAWNDRMDALRNGPCRFLVDRLQEEGRLAPDLQPEAAIDALWTFLSIQTWENLVIESGWSEEQYAARLKYMIKQVLTSS